MPSPKGGTIADVQRKHSTVSALLMDTRTDYIYAVHETTERAEMISSS